MSNYIERQAPLLITGFNQIDGYNVGNREETVKSALYTIFLTSKGEHPIEKDIGHLLDGVLFLNWNETTKTLIKQLILESIVSLEDEIEVINIIPYRDDNNKDTINIFLEYIDLITGQQNNVDLNI